MAGSQGQDFVQRVVTEEGARRALHVALVTLFFDSLFSRNQPIRPHEMNHFMSTVP